VGTQSSQRTAKRRKPKTQAHTPCLGQPEEKRGETHEKRWGETQEKSRRARGLFLRYNYVWRTPVLNSGMSEFREAAFRAQIRASRVWAGSMMASSQRRAAA